MLNLSMLESRVEIEDLARILLDWHQAEDGQDLVEYGLLASFVSIAAIATIALVGPYLQSMFSFIISQLNLT